jgi:unsaturated chondroitin disaccharide hydrolase
MNKHVLFRAASIGMLLSLRIHGVCLAQTVDREFVQNQLGFATHQLMSMADALGSTNKIPRSVKDDSIHLRSIGDWTSGFFPGSLWYVYEYSRDPAVKAKAEWFTHILEANQKKKGTHDLGFMMNCSYGNGLRLAQNSDYAHILVQTTQTLCERFNPTIGCIRSWDFGSWKFPVIIDNMMNLELLFWATKATGDQSYYKKAVSHANTTMANHFRTDQSTWHVIDYDPDTGKVRGRHTHQGQSDESAWARGQSWGLYGFTMCYRETGDPAYLKQAEAIAKLILFHSNLPSDMIPYWDYDAEDIPNEPRDASAAAITCSSFLDLYRLTHKTIYLKVADQILLSLSSPEYRAKKVGDNHHFILRHSVGSKPKKSEVNTPINYADYYYVESLMRRLALLKNE